jgi:hypothetical protein
MKRGLVGLHIAAGLESVAGCLLSIGAYQLIGQTMRMGSTRADDLLASSALALGGPAVLAAGLAGVLRVSARAACTMRRAALVAETWMVIAGVGMICVGERRGGDWASITVLGGMAFIAAGVLLLAITWVGSRFLRRVTADSSA